jgi:hypothetical protein
VARRPPHVPSVRTAGPLIANRIVGISIATATRLAHQQQKMDHHFDWFRLGRNVCRMSRSEIDLLQNLDLDLSQLPTLPRKREYFEKEKGAAFNEMQEQAHIEQERVSIEVCRHES